MNQLVVDFVCCIPPSNNYTGVLCWNKPIRGGNIYSLGLLLDIFRSTIYLQGQRSLDSISDAVFDLLMMYYQGAAVVQYFIVFYYKPRSELAAANTLLNLIIVHCTLSISLQYLVWYHHYVVQTYVIQILFSGKYLLHFQ